MGSFPNEMDDGQGINQILSRRFGLQGPPAPNMATELFPTIAPLDFATHAELAFLQNERLAIGGIAQAAVVAEQAQVGLRLDSASGVIAVVDRIVVQATASGQLVRIFMGVGDPTADAEGTRVFRDTRYGIGASTTTVFAWRRSDAVPAGSDTSAEWIMLANTMVEIPGPFVIGPGGHLSVVNNATNQALDACFFWRERAVNEGELLGAVTT